MAPLGAVDTGHGENGETLLGSRGSTRSARESSTEEDSDRSRSSVRLHPRRLSMGWHDVQEWLRDALRSLGIEDPRHK
jgi:hypothetical protein